MRIEQTVDGRFIKVLSPEMKGLIGRMYQEIRDRKEIDSVHDELLLNQGTEIEILKTKIDSLVTQYTAVSAALDELFPKNEDISHMTRPMMVDGYVKALQFISTEATAPPLVVASRAMVANLNAEMVGGQTLQDLDKRFAGIAHLHDERYAPKVHNHDTVYASINHIHGTNDLRDMKVQNEPPANPTVGYIWVDMDA